MTPAETIQVFNTTLRDGVQREGIKLCVEDSGDRAAHSEDCESPGNCKSGDPRVHARRVCALSCRCPTAGLRWHRGAATPSEAEMTRLRRPGMVLLASLLGGR